MNELLKRGDERLPPPKPGKCQYWMGDERQRYCKKAPVKGSRYCRAHRGNARKGIAHPNYKHGLRSSYLGHLSGKLVDYYSESPDGEALYDLSEQIRLADVRIIDLLGRLKGGEGGNLWQAAWGAYQQFDQAYKAQQPETMIIALDNLRKMLRAGLSDYKSWEALFAAIEMRRKLVETSKRIEFARENVMSNNEAMLFSRALLDAFRNEVYNLPISEKDRNKFLVAVQNQFLALTGVVRQKNGS